MDQSAGHTQTESANSSLDPIRHYLTTFEQLRSRKRWTTNTVTFRFVALTLGAAGPVLDYDLLEETATGLRQRARWASPLRSEVRYVVAAMILRRQLDPVRIHACVMETRDAFKALKIPSRGIGPTLAALLLALNSEGQLVPTAVLERLRDIYRRWRKDHIWLTNANDLPTAALHAGRNEAVEMLTADIEQTYDHLHTVGFRRGNALQLVSHLLAADPRGSDTGIQRFCQVAGSLKGTGERAGPSRYDEMALLALTREPPALVVERVLEYRDRLRKAKPRPTSDVAFSLAAGIQLAEDNQQAVDSNAGDLAALQSLQAILEAQQAATMAAVSAGASSGASGGS